MARCAAAYAPELPVSPRHPLAVLHDELPLWYGENIPGLPLRKRSNSRVGKRTSSLRSPGNMARALHGMCALVAITNKVRCTPTELRIGQLLFRYSARMFLAFNIGPHLPSSLFRCAENAS